MLAGEDLLAVDGTQVAVQGDGVGVDGGVDGGGVDVVRGARGGGGECDRIDEVPGGFVLLVWLGGIIS